MVNYNCTASGDIQDKISCLAVGGGVGGGGSTEKIPQGLGMSVL